MHTWTAAEVHSLFVQPSEHRAYAVLGLNDRIRDIIAGVGVVIETGLVQYLARSFAMGSYRALFGLEKLSKQLQSRV